MILVELVIGFDQVLVVGLRGRIVLSVGVLSIAHDDAWLSVLSEVSSIGDRAS